MGDTWHAQLPWDEARAAYRKTRARFFSSPRPEGTYWLVDASTQEVMADLGAMSFAPNWEFSYHKRGEDLNLARVVYSGNEPRDAVWWQDHVRGWETDRGLELGGHWELEPTENPVDHILARGIDRRRGMANIADALEIRGYEPTRVEWTR